MSDIIEASIGPIRLLDCLSPDADCEFTGECGSRRMWGLINVRITDVLNEYTLADLSEKQLREKAERLEKKGKKAGARTC